MWTSFGTSAMHANTVLLINVTQYMAAINQLGKQYNNTQRNIFKNRLLSSQEQVNLSI